MKNKYLFRNDEELNVALDNVYEIYRKPPTKKDNIYIIVWLEILPFLGIIGFVCGISWLFYIVGGIIALTEVFFLFTGALRCLGTVLLMVSCIIGYCLTKSLLIGLLLGSCITGALLGAFFMVGLLGGSTTTDVQSDLQSNGND